MKQMIVDDEYVYCIGILPNYSKHIPNYIFINHPNCLTLKGIPSS